MAFTEGNTHGKGRPKGTTNKKKAFSVADTLAKHNFDPIAHLMKILPELDYKDQSRVCLQLLNYLEPALKATDAPPAVEDEVSKMSDEELEKLAKAA